MSRIFYNEGINLSALKSDCEGELPSQRLHLDGDICQMLLARTDGSDLSHFLRHVRDEKLFG